MDYRQQLALFRAYIRVKYGTAEQVIRAWQQPGWYSRGGR